MVGRPPWQKFLGSGPGEKAGLLADRGKQGSRPTDPGQKSCPPALAPLQGSARAGWLLVSAFHSRQRSCSGLGASSTIGALTL